MQQHRQTPKGALGRASHKLAWSTRERRGATIGAFVGLVCAILLPGFGIASSGMAANGRLVAIVVLMLIGALAGARIAVATSRK